MKRNHLQKYYLQKAATCFFVGIVVAFLSFFVHNLHNQNSLNKGLFKYFQKNFLANEKTVDYLFAYFQENKIPLNSFDLITLLKEENINQNIITVLIYQDSNLVAWSDNSCDFSSNLRFVSTEKIKIEKGKNLYIKRLSVNDIQILACLKLNNFEKKTSNLKIREVLPQNNLIDIGQGFIIKNISGENLFYLALSDEINKNTDRSFLLVFLWIISFTCIILCGICLLLTSKYLQAQKNFLFFIILSFVFSLIMCLNFFCNFQSELFSPIYYSSHYRSLGHLFINAFGTLFIAVAFDKLLFLQNKNTYSYRSKIIVSSIWLLVVFLFNISIYRIIAGVTNDSIVILKPEMVYQYDGYSVIAILSIVMLIWSVFIVTRKSVFETFKLIGNKKNYFQLISWELLLFLLLVSVYSLINNKLQASVYPLLLFALLFILIVVKVVFVNKNRGKIFFDAFIYLTISLIVFLIAERSVNERDDKYKYSIAEIMMANEDPYVSFNLSEMIKEMRTDSVLQAFFGSYPSSTADLQSYILEKYLKEYTRTFGIQIDMGVVDDPDFQTRIKKIENKYFLNKQSIVPNQSIFYRETFGKSQYVVCVDIKNPTVANSSKGRNQEPVWGKIIIVLFQHFLQSQSSLQSENLSLRNYCFAGYENNHLKMNIDNQNFSYFFNLSDYHLDTIYSGQTFTLNNVNHLVYKQGSQVLFVSSINAKFWKTFSFLLLLFLAQIIFSVVPFLLSLIYRDKNKRSISISSTTQTLIIILVISSVFISTLFMIHFFSMLRDKDQETIKIAKSKNIFNIITTALVDTKEINEIDYQSMRNIETKLSTFFDLNDLDLNIYNKQGYLLKSYGLGIYTNSRIEPTDFLSFNVDKLTPITHQEQTSIGKFSCVDRALLNEEGETIGYISLVFPNKLWTLTDVKYSQFVTKFIAICISIVFLIIILTMFLIARISKPLFKVTERLSHINLGDDAKPIEWKNDNEMGQLVSTYNFLISRLKANAELLEQTSQEMAWKDMARQVAHEIKNPLTPIRLKTQMLMRDLENEKIDKEKIVSYFKMINEQTEVLIDIATSFSHFAQINANKATAENLIEVINNSISLFRSVEDNVVIHFNNKISLEKALVMMERTQLVSVFNNLIKNAVQAKKGEETLTITIDLSEFGEKMWQIAIKDTGIGITDEIKGKVFQPKFTTKSSGTGLGLAMVKNILTTWGGNIYFKSEYGKGTTFFVILPKFVEKKDLEANPEQFQ